MPYSMDQPEKLPENVRKLSEKKQKVWVEVFNSAYKACQEEEETPEKCETTAFAQANGAVKDDDDSKGVMTLKDVPEAYTEDSERNAYMGAYNTFYKNCMDGASDDKRKGCRDGAHSAGQSAVRKKRKKKAAGDYSDSSMIAFYLPEDVTSQITLGVPGAIPADELHLTLCYLGKTTDMTEKQVDDIKRAVSLWAKQQVPVDVRINGLARFTKTTDEGAQPLVALLDSRHLKSLQYSLESYVKYDGGFDYDSEHTFMPHVTLGYLPQGALWPIQNLPELKFPLKSVVFKVGEMRYDLELTGEMSEGVTPLDMPVPVLKAGARNSSRDLGDIQTIHDKAYALGAKCGDMDEAKALSFDPAPAIKTVWTCGNPDHEHGTPQEAMLCIKRASLDTDLARKSFVSSPHNVNALKAIEKTDEHLTVANYMILFGGRDLEGIASHKVNPDGSKGEYFTKNTNFSSDYTETGRLLVDWEHRTQPDGVGPDAEDIFGFVDWKSAIIDETGLFVKRILNRRNKYVKMLEALIDAGMIGSSSEPVQKGVVKGSNGEIQVWPLKRDSFTVSPMDPRMMSVNHLEVIKALKDNPDGEEIYNNIFQTEKAIAQARALSLISQIGEST